MRIILQRVSAAAVSVDGNSVAAIDRGYLLLLGISPRDTPAEAATLAQKIVHLRLFPNKAGKFDRSLLDVGGSALVVSQFTLFADARKGRRPSFTDAAPPQHAAPLVDHFARQLRDGGVVCVQTGRFGAHMHVTLTNDGPVTISLDTDDL